jgi:hypothetical protein
MTNGLSNGVILISQKLKQLKKKKGILNEMTKEAYKTVAFGLELKLVHTIHVIKQRILEIMRYASAYGIKNLQRILPN